MDDPMLTQVLLPTDPAALGRHLRHAVPQISHPVQRRLARLLLCRSAEDGPGCGGTDLKLAPWTGLCALSPLLSLSLDCLSLFFCALCFAPCIGCIAWAGGGNWVDLSSSRRPSHMGVLLSSFFCLCHGSFCPTVFSVPDVLGGSAAHTIASYHHTGGIGIVYETDGRRVVPGGRPDCVCGLKGERDQSI